MSREMFVYNFTMSNLVSVFPHVLRHRIREKRIIFIKLTLTAEHKTITKRVFEGVFRTQSDI